jgi:hypothetical protein
MGVGGQRHAPAALPPVMTRYPLYRRLDGPQGRSGRVRKISPPTGIRSPNRQARSESLYGLSYPGPPLKFTSVFRRLLAANLDRRITGWPRRHAPLEYDTLGRQNVAVKLKNNERMSPVLRNLMYLGVFAVCSSAI